MSVAKIYREHIILKNYWERILLKTLEDSLEDLLEMPLEAESQCLWKPKDL